MTDARARTAHASVAADAARRRTPARLPARARALPPWSLIAAGVLAGGLSGGGYGVLTPPAYTATGYVVAVPTERSDPLTALGFAQAYGRAAMELAVLGDAQARAGVPVRTLRRSVRISTSPDAPVIAVTATSARPGRAAGMANAVSRALTRHSARAAGAEGGAAVTLRLFARATVPGEPSSASAGATGLVGASAGGLLGALVLLARPRRTAAEPGTGPLPAPAPVPAPAGPATTPHAAASGAVTGPDAHGQP
ncbi:MAG TPA: lipopolysaccharide biosynthesis protein [Streptomyces sp.]|nr:lipopolysaccharide biosynthesis protein [Streptomyces sp.]